MYRCWLETIPGGEHQLCLFVAILHSERVSIATVKGYLSAVRYTPEDCLGLPGVIYAGLKYVTNGATKFMNTKLLQQLIIALAVFLKAPSRLGVAT